MTLEGHACAFGAGTIINAIATWKGAAFGIDLKTFADVELSESESVITGSIKEVPEGDTRLIERCVELVLGRFGLELGGTIRTWGEIPLAGGLRAAVQQQTLQSLRPFMRWGGKQCPLLRS